MPALAGLCVSHFSAARRRGGGQAAVSPAWGPQCNATRPRGSPFPTRPWSAARCFVSQASCVEPWGPESSSFHTRWCHLSPAALWTLNCVSVGDARWAGPRTPTLERLWSSRAHIWSSSASPCLWGLVTLIQVSPRGCVSPFLRPLFIKGKGTFSRSPSPELHSVPLLVPQF